MPCYLPYLIGTPRTCDQTNVTEDIERNAQERVRRNSFTWKLCLLLCCTFIVFAPESLHWLPCPLHSPFAFDEHVHCAGRRSGRATSAAGSKCGSQTAKKWAAFADTKGRQRHYATGIRNAGSCSVRQCMRCRIIAVYWIGLQRLRCLSQLGYQFLAPVVKDKRINGSAIAACSDHRAFAKLFPALEARESRKARACFDAMQRYLFSAAQTRVSAGDSLLV